MRKVALSGYVMFLARMPFMSPDTTSKPNSVSYPTTWPSPGCAGQAEFARRGLRLVAGPHWNRATNSELLGLGLPPDFAMPLVGGVPLVPQASSSGPPKASPAPTNAESRRNSRLDLRE